ncbi:hypothetical protein [Silvanigrella aquatica]|uniref:Uncharacterized protein n=1 Tax=Silvanigrella aquatica TaxID=1915309 RepID=A0A1L4D363_9BACT|nr:hypothetical protein [Silvanigrella aquatica]APJ04648.1 hypothetical protein AXG55_12335 [Silvanigrella aquatica]
MKKLIQVLTFGVISTHLLAFSSESSTKWKLKNNSKEDITLSCKNATEEKSNISMTSRPIKPGKTETFDWGDNYYNDGLGLNAGKWSCITKNKTNLPTEFDQFSSDWGENISLVINSADGKLKLIKVEKKDPSIAVKKEEIKDNSVE